MYRFLGIWIAGEENPGQLQLGDLCEDCATSHCFKLGLFLINEVGRIRMLFIRKEMKRDRTLASCLLSGMGFIYLSVFSKAYYSNTSRYYL